MPPPAVQWYDGSRCATAAAALLGEWGGERTTVSHGVTGRRYNAVRIGNECKQVQGKRLFCTTGHIEKCGAGMRRQSRACCCCTGTARRDSSRHERRARGPQKQSGCGHIPTEMLYRAPHAAVMTAASEAWCWRAASSGSTSVLGHREYCSRTSWSARSQKACKRGACGQVGSVWKAVSRRMRSDMAGKGARLTA